MGADPQEVDLQQGLTAWFGAGNGNPSTMMNAIWTNYRSNTGNWVAMPGEVFGQGDEDNPDNNARTYNPDMPLNGLLRSFGLDRAAVWYPLKRVQFANTSNNERFSLEDELVLQRMRVTGRYRDDGQDPASPNEWPSRLARVLKAGGLEPDNNQALQRRLTIAARSLTTVSRTQAAGRMWDAGGNSKWIEKIDINTLNTDVAPSDDAGKDFQQLCVSVLGETPEAANLAGSIAMFTSDYAKAATGYAFGDSMNPWVAAAEVPVPHRLPVLAGYFFKFVKDPDDNPDKHKYALAIQILNPFETELPLNGCELILGDPGAATPHTVPLGNHTLNRLDGGRSSLVVLLQPKGTEQDALDNPGDCCDTDTCAVDGNTSLDPAIMNQLLAGTIPQITLRYHDGAPAPFADTLIDKIDQGMTNSPGETETLIRVRPHPFDGVAALAEKAVDELLKEYTEFTTWRNPVETKDYPILHMGGQEDKFASPAQVGLLLSKPMSKVGDADAHRWYDSNNSGKLDEGDFVTLRSLVKDHGGGKIADFFDCTRTFVWPDDPTLDLGLININTADFYAASPAPRTLLALPWMTSEVATRIMNSRDPANEGPYRSIGELLLRDSTYSDFFNEAQPLSDDYKNGAGYDDRFESLNLGTAQDKHAVQFLFGLLCNRATTRSHMFTVRVEVTLKQVDDDGAAVGDPLCTEALTAIVDRSTGKCRILNKFWGAPIVEE
jgi:hypothetical protein